MELLWFLIVVVAFLVGYYIIIYNSLIQAKNLILRGWAQIDVLLKERHDELPKLVATCKEYMKYEQEAFVKIMNARNKVADAREKRNVYSLSRADNELHESIGQLFALSENYPELKANDGFRHLRVRITALEQQIADRREEYNSCVNHFNTRIEQFPDLILARQFKMKAAEYLKFTAEETKDVEIKF